MDNKKYIVRDILAFDRTYLANERTFLSYTRTFIGMIGAGAALYKLFDVIWARAAAVVLLVLAPLLFLFGLARFIQLNRQLKTYKPDE